VAARRREPVRPAAVWLGQRQHEVALAAQLGDRFLWVVERLAVLARLILDGPDALALLGAGEDRGRPSARGFRLRVRGLDRIDVVAVDLDRVPAERVQARGVAVEVPAQHRLAGLAEPVDVDDRDEVVQVLPGGVLEGSHIEPSAISESPQSTQTR
jgi:hypothetical protein